MKCLIIVTVQTASGADSLILFSETLDYCKLSDSQTFYSFLKRNFPLLEWDHEDGDDFDDDNETTYCQYVSYPEGRNVECGCVLAQLDVIK